MNKSSVCTYKFGNEVRNKKKYLTVESARAVAKYITGQPTTIHVFREYKCSTCHHFHIGKTTKLTGNTGIYSPEAETVPEDVMIEMVDLPTMQIEPVTDEVEEVAPPARIDNWAPLAGQEIGRVQRKSDLIPETKNITDEFDWDSLKKGIKKLK